MLTALDKQIIVRKLDFMRGTLLEMEEILRKGERAYRRNRMDQLATERHIERLVEWAVDVACIILKKNYQLTVPTYPDAFLVLGRRGVLSTKLASGLASSARIRDAIAHLIDDLTPGKVFTGAKTALRHYPAFMKTVRTLTKR
ncbi:MAG TPA: HepT-like ribonuclease domain-containing protein [Bdellovibrionota bacterium]|nr:HepT-like ribonuclease domain-containing protein [Bdellovibrionota bacterium]